jgi:hypothetical protein
MSGEMMKGVLWWCLPPEQKATPTSIHFVSCVHEDLAVCSRREGGGIITLLVCEPHGRHLVPYFSSIEPKCMRFQLPFLRRYATRRCIVRVDRRNSHSN